MIAPLAPKLDKLYRCRLLRGSHSRYEQGANMTYRAGEELIMSGVEVEAHRLRVEVLEEVEVRSVVTSVVTAEPSAPPVPEPTDPVAALPVEPPTVQAPNAWIEIANTAKLSDIVGMVPDLKYEDLVSLRAAEVSTRNRKMLLVTIDNRISKLRRHHAA